MKTSLMILASIMLISQCLLAQESSWIYLATEDSRVAIDKSLTKRAEHIQVLHESLLALTKFNSEEQKPESIFSLSNDSNLYIESIDLKDDLPLYLGNQAVYDFKIQLSDGQMFEINSLSTSSSSGESCSSLSVTVTSGNSGVILNSNETNRLLERFVGFLSRNQK